MANRRTQHPDPSSGSAHLLPIGTRRSAHLLRSAHAGSAHLLPIGTRRLGAARRSAPPAGPFAQALQRPGRDDPVGGHAGPLGPLGAVVEQRQLPGRVRVGVDREEASRARARCAMRSSGGSCRSGRELISTATPCSAQAANTALRVERRRRAACRASPRRAVRCTWPSTSIRAARDGGDQARASSARAPCAASSARRRRRRRARRSRSGSWSRAPSSRMSTSMPDSSVKPSPLMPATTVELLRAAARRERPSRDAQPRGVVGDREVLVPERRRRVDHQLDRGEAVRPLAVGVQVAPQLRPQLRRALRARRRSRRSAR